MLEMIDDIMEPEGFAPYMGFMEGEVRQICEKHEVPFIYGLPENLRLQIIGKNVKVVTDSCLGRRSGERRENLGPYSTYCSLREHPEVKSMRLSRQHKNTDTYSHCCRVALRSVRLIRRMGIRADMDAVVRGAMLHDFHLDDVRNGQYSSWQRARLHPQVALENAERICELGWRERNIICSHMWPIKLGDAPACREAVIVNVADKLCAIEERFLSRRLGGGLEEEVAFLRELEKAV